MKILEDGKSPHHESCGYWLNSKCDLDCASILALFSGLPEDQQTFSPETAWAAIRTHLAILLGEPERQMWVRHTRLVSALTGPTAMFTAIPKFFLREPGKLLSIADFRVLELFAEVGFPVSIVRLGIQEMFDKYPQRQLNSIRFCWSSILAEMELAKEACIGTSVSPDKGRQTQTLLIALPRSGRAIYGANRHLFKMRNFACTLNFDLALTVEPDNYQLAYWKEKYDLAVSYLEKAPSELWNTGGVA